LPDPAVLIEAPRGDADWEAYYALRWRLLRAPWGQPAGSERDAFEAAACHRLARTPEGEIVGVGRIHRLDARSAQVRYLAVDESWQGRGIGARLLACLEGEAAAWAVTQVVAQVRRGAEDFYTARGYARTGPGPTLFGTIRHVWMAKSLAPDTPHGHA